MFCMLYVYLGRPMDNGKYPYTNDHGRHISITHIKWIIEWTKHEKTAKAPHIRIWTVINWGTLHQCFSGLSDPTQKEQFT